MTTPHPEPPRARKPALKLVKTQELSRDDWLAVRRTGIGGSDAAAAVGLNPYMSALELWLDKTGRADGLPRPDPDDTTSPTYWGTLLEPHRRRFVHEADGKSRTAGQRRAAASLNPLHAREHRSRDRRRSGRTDSGM